MKYKLIYKGKPIKIAKTIQDAKCMKEQLNIAFGGGVTVQQGGTNG